MADGSNSISFDRERSEKRAQAGEQTEEVRNRVAQMRAAGTGPQLRPTSGEPGPPETPTTAAAEEDASVKARAGALQAVLRRYRKVNDQFLLKDEENTPAFRDKGDKLVTSHDDPEIARSMVDLARAKGWDCLAVSGSRAFRAEVWLYASAHGLEVSGYTPTALDKVKLSELREDVVKVAHGSQLPAQGTSTRTPEAPSQPAVQPHAKPEPAPSNPSPGAAPSPGVSEQAHLADVPPPLTPRHEAALAAMETILRASSSEYPAGHTQAQIDAAMKLARSEWTNDRVYVGRLLEHGPAAYEFRHGGSPSYFVKLEDPHGARFTLWGLDFPRALEAARHQPDDDLVISFCGSQRVEVPRILHSENGPRRVEYDVVNRNVWNVVPVRALAPEQAREALQAAKKANGPDMQAVRLSVSRPRQKNPQQELGRRSR